MAKNYFNRYVWLIDLINRHGYIKFPEIQRAWERSALNTSREPLYERTFFNHKEAILDTFGLEILCDRSMGYYISNNEEIGDDGIKNWLLQSLSMNNILNESSDMRGRILFENVPSGQKFLTEIISAMRDGKVINMTYQSFWKDEPSTFDAYPYCLKVFRQRWYMVAGSEAHDKMRVYALDRIIDMEEMEESFELPEGFDAEGYFNDNFGIVKGTAGDVADVKIKVDASQVKYYRSLPLHHSQRETETTEQYSIFQYHIATTFDFYQEILSKGDTVEVLEPADFRDWIAKTASKMNTVYNGN